MTDNGPPPGVSLIRISCDGKVAEFWGHNSKDNKMPIDFLSKSVEEPKKRMKKPDAYKNIYSSQMGIF
jgi:hypothetical protein